METKLRQVNVTYVETEDRLLLKVSTSDDQEYRAWCTRRYTHILLERLEILLQDEVDDGQVVPQSARKEVARIKHSGRVAEESFNKPYEAEPVSFPLGEDGLLLTTLRYKTLESGMITLSLSNSNGKGITLNLDRNLRHQLFELFNRAAKRANWFQDPPSGAPAVVH